MSAEDMFFSWANWIKTKLAADSVPVNVYMYRESNPTPPYLFLEDGPEFPTAKDWLTGMIVQAWFVVTKVPGEKIEVTFARLKKQVLTSLRDPGLIQKYNYSGASPVATNKYIEMNRISGSPQTSGDPNRSQQALRWELYSNS